MAPIVLLFVSVLISPRLSASESYRTQTENWLIQSWEREDGLPENSATSMVQTPDGYLWFGTFNGLVRFNGAQFTVFNRGNTPELPSTGIVNLHVDIAGKLWVSTYAGIVVGSKGQWRSVGTGIDWQGDVVRTFSERTNGDLLITTFDGKVLEFSSGRLVLLPLPPGESGKGYFGYVDESNQWWVVQNRFIGKWDGRQWVSMVDASALSATSVACCRSRDGGLWLLLGNELRLLRNGTEVSRIAVPDLPHDFWSMSQDSRGNLWICTSGNGLYQVTLAGQTIHWNTAHGLSHKAVRFVFEDREGSLWVGTSGGGLLRLKERSFRSVGESQGLKEKVVHSVCADLGGEMQIATYGQGLFRGTERGVAPVPLPGIKERVFAQSVLADRAGRLWMGTFRQGLWLFETQGVRRISGDNTGGDNILALFEDSRGHIWMGGGGRGAALYNGRDFRVFGPSQGLPNGGVRCFAEDKDGAIWLSNLQGVFRFQDPAFAEVLYRGQPIREITCLKADSDGMIWMGSLNRGLLRWLGGELTAVDQKAGLPVSAIHAILEDQEHFWMTSDHGIVRARRTDLLRAATGDASPLKHQLFDVSDGLPTIECTVGHQPMCARDANGKLWFATMNGVAVIDPSACRFNTAVPPMEIEEFSWYGPASKGGGDEESVARHKSTPRKEKHTLRPPFSDAIILAPGSRRLEFQYAGLSFVAPGKVRYQIKLDGEDSDWQDAGNRRTAYYHDVRPGRYVFRVRAANNDGVWNEAGASLAFTMLPFFWQTAWFRAFAWGAAGIEGVLIFALLLNRRRLRTTQGELIESNERIHLAAQAAKLAVWVWDVRCDKIWVTEDGRELFGWRDAEPLNFERFLATVHPEHRELIDATVRAALEGGGQFDREYRILHPDGSTRWMAARGQVEFDHAGKPLRMRGIAIDITERKRSAEALKQSEQRFRLAVDAAPNAMLMVSHQGRITLANAEAGHLFGYTHDELLGMDVEQLVPERFRAAHGMHRADFFANPQARAMGAGRELFGRRKDGAEVPVEIGLNPLHTTEGTFVLASIIDITERKRNAEKLQQSEQRFRLAVDAAPNAMLMVAREGRITLANIQAELLFGYTRAELLGMEVEQLIPERFRTSHGKYRSNFFMSPEARAMGAGRELFGQRKDGTEVPIEIGLNPLHTAEGTFVLASIINISERKQAEAALQEQRQQLTHLTRVAILGELSGALAHELNQPLTAILSNAQAALRFLKADSVDLDELREILKDIVEEDQRAGEVILRLRALFKRDESKRQSLELNEVTREVLKLMHSDLVTRNVVLITQFDPGIAPVTGDRVQLQQVLLNLILNACDAVVENEPANRRLTIRTEWVDQDAIKVSVSDSGVGIARDQMEKIFQPFITTKPHGIGLGLAISRSIVEAHAGRLWATNNSEGGATFSFLLPANRKNGS